MQKLRVILLSYEKELLDSKSGAFERIKGYAHDRVSLTAVVLSRSAESHQSQDDSLSVVSSGKRSGLGRFFSSLFLIRKAIHSAKRDGETSLIAAQDPFIAGFLAFVASRFFDVPYEVQEHGDFFSGEWKRERYLNWWLARVGRFVLRRADYVRVVSDRIRDGLIRRFGISEDRIFVSPVAQDLSLHRRFEYRGAQYIAPVLVAPCRFVKQKGLDILLRSAMLLKKEGISFSLRLIGSGPEENRLRRMIRVFDLEDCVEILPWASQEDIWSKADLFVMSSRYEGWGRTIIEAMAAGVPIVTTDVGCVGSVLRPQIDGRVVRIGDARMLADAIKEQIVETDRREWMVQNARERVKMLMSEQVRSDRQRASWQELVDASDSSKDSHAPLSTLHSLLDGRRVWMSTIALIGFAGIVRLTSVILFWQSLGVNREWGFFRLIQNWFLGYGYSFVDAIGCASAYRSPGYLFFLTGVYGLFGFANFLAQAIIQNLFAIGIVYLVYRLGWKLSKNRLVGLFAGVVTALHPYTFYHYTQYYHTFLQAFFLVFLLLMLTYLADTKRMVYAFWSGVGIAFLAYVQGTILPATVFLSLWLLIKWWPDWKKTFIAVGIMAIISAGMIAPWTYRNWKVFGTFVPLTTDLGHAFAKANNGYAYAMTALGYPQEAGYNEVHNELRPLETYYHQAPEVQVEFDKHGIQVVDTVLLNQWHPLEPGLRYTCEEQLEYPEPEFNAYWMGRTMDWLSTHYWTDGIKLQAQKIVQFWSPRLQPIKRYGAAWSFGNEGLIATLVKWSLIAYVFTLEIFALIGLWFAWKKQILGRLAPILIVFGIYTLLHSFFAGYTKYRIPLDALLAIIAVYGFVSLIGLLIDKKRAKSRH